DVLEAGALGDHLGEDALKIHAQREIEAESGLLVYIREHAVEDGHLRAEWLSEVARDASYASVAHLRLRVLLELHLSEELICVGRGVPHTMEQQSVRDLV